MRSLLVLTVLCVLASAASAQGYYSSAPAPGAYAHDGFYLRLDLGVGGTSFSSSDLDTDVSGAGGTFGVAVGGAVAENLIVYGELFDDVAVNPKVRIGSFSATTQDTSAGVVGVGVGLAYYFMPANIYLSATLAASRLTVDHNNDEVAHSAWGGGLSLMVGKEWWVSEGWGLGVAAQLYGGKIRDDSSGSPTWNVGALALVFSATYN